MKFLIIFILFCNVSFADLLNSVVGGVVAGSVAGNISHNRKCPTCDCQELKFDGRLLVAFDDLNRAEGKFKLCNHHYKLITTGSDHDISMGCNTPILEAKENY